MEGRHRFDRAYSQGVSFGVNKDIMMDCSFVKEYCDIKLVDAGRRFTKFAVYFRYVFAGQHGRMIFVVRDIRFLISRRLFERLSKSITTQSKISFSSYKNLTAL